MLAPGAGRSNGLLAVPQQTQIRPRVHTEAPPLPHVLETLHKCMARPTHLPRLQAVRYLARRRGLAARGAPERPLNAGQLGPCGPFDRGKSCQRTNKDGSFSSTRRGLSELTFQTMQCPNLSKERHRGDQVYAAHRLQSLDDRCQRPVRYALADRLLQSLDALLYGRRSDRVRTGHGRT